MLELGIDIGPGGLGAFLQPDEAIVENHRPGYEQGYEEAERPQYDAVPSGSLAQSRR